MKTTLPMTRKHSYKPVYTGLNVVLFGKSQGREDALYWLDDMAQDGKIDTALVFGTLKAPPSGLPETIQPVWIEAGVAGEIREAA